MPESEETPSVIRQAEPTSDDTPLGEPGQKALNAMKEELKSARADLRTARTAEAELQELREANQTESEKALEAARAEGDQSARTEMGSQLLTARVELAILKSEDARKLADPSDALVFIDVGDVVDKDGAVKVKALTAAIDALIEAKPHLAASTSQRVPKVPGGPRTPGTPEPGPGKERLMAAFADAEK